MNKTAFTQIKLETNLVITVKEIYDTQFSGLCIRTPTEAVREALRDFVQQFPRPENRPAKSTKPANKEAPGRQSFVNVDGIIRRVGETDAEFIARKTRIAAGEPP